MIGRRWVKWCLAALLGTLMVFSAGCGGPKIMKVGLQAEVEANQNSPIAVAVLAVYDKDLFKELSKLSAKEWFEQEEQRLKDNPDQTLFTHKSWEILPLQRVREEWMALRDEDDIKGLVFADYTGEGKFRMRFDPLARVLINLSKNDFQVVVLEASSKSAKLPKVEKPEVREKPNYGTPDVPGADAPAAPGAPGGGGGGAPGWP